MYDVSAAVEYFAAAENRPQNIAAGHKSQSDPPSVDG